MIATQPLSTQSPHVLTSQSLQQLGMRFGIDYRIEGSGGRLATVAQGSVHDVGLNQALHLTLSDLQVERTYR